MDIEIEEICITVFCYKSNLMEFEEFNVYEMNFKKLQSWKSSQGNLIFRNRLLEN